MNYFDSQIAAERYKKGRPDFHANTIKQIQGFLQLNNKFDKALDIACGTGLSTKALLEIANSVWGTDSSSEMLERAFKNEKIQYNLAAAEHQPFNDHEFDLITVSSGVHWFDIDRFLSESNRLLKSKSWLVLYENYFLSEMEGVEAFAEWFPSSYLRKYPSPPRNNNYDWSSENLRSKNFEFITELRFKNSVAFDKEQLISYLTTQSNIISAVARGESVYAEVEDWLRQELSQFFGTGETSPSLYFGNWIKFIRRID